MTRRSALMVALLASPTVVLQACVFELAELDHGTGGAGAGGNASGPGGAPADWWDEAFAHRMALGLTGESDAIDDAVLPVFLDASFPYDQVEPAGADLRFVDPDGELLPYEIERWDPSGDSLLWVRIPEVAAGSEDRVWLYWGNPGQPPGDTPAATWVGYESVVHMSEAIAGDTVIDNPAEGDDLLATGLSAGSAVDGPLAQAYRFDGGTGQAISAMSDGANAVPTGGQATLEGWYRWDGSTEGTLVVHEGCCLGYLIELTDDNALFLRWGTSDCCSGGTAYDLVPSPVLPNGSETGWHHYVIVIDRAAGEASFYLDGEPVGTPAAIVPGPDFNAQGTYRIGADFGVNANFGGELDEARFANFAYSPSRIRLYARAGLDEVIGYGTPQMLP